MKRIHLPLLLICLSLLLAGCPFDSDDSTSSLVPDPSLTSGLKTLTVDGASRSYYLDLPDDYLQSAAAKPLIIAYHGTTGSHEAWLNGSYPLKDAVGNGAVLIYPDARLNAAGYTQWDYDADSAMFQELLATLPASLRYDPNRIFVTGHSSGAGFTNTLGCRYGDQIRAIAPVSGSLTDATCTGSIAVLHIQGNKDTIAPPGLAEIAHRFWVLYNGYELNVSEPGVEAPCIDHSLGSLDYPVQWCLHEEGDGPTGHSWPSFASHAIWTFFSGLNELAPRAEAPPGGGNARALGNNDTTMSFTLHYPAGIATPIRGSVVVYALGTRQPIGAAPTAFLNLDFAPGAASPGADVVYQVPIRYIDFAGGVTFPGSYTIEIVVFVEGGQFPIPLSGVDHQALVDLTLTDKTTPIVVPGVLALEPVQTTF